MISRRKLLLGLGLGALPPAFPLLAQQAKVARIGILSARFRSTPANPEPFFGAFVQGMRDLGYVEGKNLVIEWRYADGKSERLAGLAAELVQLKPDVIVTHQTPAAALKQATTTIPVVVASFSDPVGSGFAKSLARPGGNVTGVSIASVDLSAKQLELLKILLPALSRVAVLVNPGLSYHAVVLKNVQAAAQVKGIRVMPVQAGNPQEIERGFEVIAREGVNAVVIPADSLYVMQTRHIGELAMKHRISTMHAAQDRGGGGLMSYGPDVGYAYRRTATYVDKILKGAKAGEMPIEQPTKFFLVINRKTAKALGITIPQELLARADEVID